LPGKKTVKTGVMLKKCFINVDTSKSPCRRCQFSVARPGRKRARLTVALVDSINVRSWLLGRTGQQVDVLFCWPEMGSGAFSPESAARR
jgi:hypothetical protein